MFIIDQWAERHISEAQKKGAFDDLPGRGKPLHLEDNLCVPQELRAVYHVLANAGYLPPELMDRKEAITLSAIMREIAIDDPDYESISKRLRLLELRLQQAGIDTQFLRGSYRSSLSARIGRLESDDE
ncbi:DnaJ family domain-containing protein [Lonsdalea quercina]|uniref:DnaJ homologue subfamily C member 28 conserved domain-containing protein n=1 Tax=Lonsdalea quercina TaxID=71657 RepID=A0A1H4FZI0_9GAMM|nr:DnaJ family domain-containing protein [Lonsdalea quercina]SEB02749.1 protein of unknown function [Lonsdalea quercina]